MDFNQKVIEQSFSIPVLVEFSGVGCGPCLWVEKQLVDITKARSREWNFISINVKDYPELVDNYQIVANPTVIFFQQGKETARIRSALPKIAVEQWIDDQIYS